MVKNNQKVILILISALLLFTSIVAVMINLNIKDDDNQIVTNKPIINKEITRLNNSNEYFTVQRTINDFYTMAFSSEKDQIFSLLDSDFVKENDINSDNLLTKLNVNSVLITFIAEQIYFNDNSNITYYFIKGYLVEAPVEEGDVSYQPNKYYLLIVDNNNHYVLKPLDNIDNLEAYAKSYDIKEVNVNNNTDFKKQETSDNNKLINYINIFSNLMNVDETKAYEMLDDETKKKYSNLDSFVNDIDNIYANLFTSFKATSKKENDDNIVYKVQNRNMDTITITEYFPNDYKIGFNFE